MANEAVIIELLGNGGDVVRFTVDNAVAVAKGTLMYLSADPRTTAATAADGNIFVGIASEEKVANDGKTDLGVYTHGIFDLVDSGAGMTLGDIAKINGANLLATADEAGAQGVKEEVGLVLETTDVGERVAVLINKP